MAKLITKFKYLKPNARRSIGGYAKYIATREGVEKIDRTRALAPCSVRQKKLIERLLRDFPDCKEMPEYEDYRSAPTNGNASEFIARALEDNAYEAMQTKTYADYIATRPRAQRFGSHGLFTDDGVVVKLNEVSDELNRHEGNVWTVILSLRREDAERLGYNTGERWRDMLRTQTEALAASFKIPMTELKWYAACDHAVANAPPSEDKTSAYPSHATSYAALRLLRHLTQLLQSKLENEHRENYALLDRKLKRKIEEKKQAQGLRQ